MALGESSEPSSPACDSPVVMPAVELLPVPVPYPEEVWLPVP